MGRAQPPPARLLAATRWAHRHRPLARSGRAYGCQHEPGAQPRARTLQRGLDCAVGVLRRPTVGRAVRYSAVPLRVVRPTSRNPTWFRDTSSHTCAHTPSLVPTTQTAAVCLAGSVT